MAAILQSTPEMSRPRCVLPCSTYLLTRRCTQRMFLLRPDDEVNNAFLYCIIVAAKLFDVELLLPSALANHHHTGVFDRHGRISDFAQHFHKLLAKCLNVFRGRRENFWSSEEPCMTRLETRDDVLDKLAYAAANPVKDGLVESVHQWPGVNGLSALLNRRVLRARRPWFFFSADGPMPDEVSIELVIPPELGDPDQFRSELRARVEALEAEAAGRRRATGARVLGRRAILRQSWSARPTSDEPRRTLRPRFAARDRQVRIAALQRYRGFLAEYREARNHWLASNAATFPYGTYWLKRFANVTVAGPPSSAS